MKIYQNSYTSMVEGSIGEHAGFEYFSSHREARRIARESRDHYDILTRTLDFKPTRGGIIQLLNSVAEHPDNG